ncbi:MAG: DUF1007 family protein [Paracoccaceae bacterium]
MRLAWAMAVAAFATPVLAHPHVFVDAGVEVIFDAQGQAEALRVSWTYDDLYSLLVIEERGLDTDFDGVLTANEDAALAGFDMAWQAGFAGDTYVLLGDAALGLSGPSEWTAVYAEGRITSTHLRRFEAPVAVRDLPLVVQVYDPSFYTAYAIALETKLTGAAPGCSYEAFEPDREAADAKLQAALEEYSGSEGVEGDFPAVGAAYSEEVRITCNGGS